MQPENYKDENYCQTILSSTYLHSVNQGCWLVEAQYFNKIANVNLIFTIYTGRRYQYLPMYILRFECHRSCRGAGSYWAGQGQLSLIPIKVCQNIHLSLKSFIL